MGHCTSQIQQNKSPQKSNAKKFGIGTMKFNSELFNIRLSHPSRSCHLKIDIGGYYKCDTPKHFDLEGKHGWKRKITLQLEANEIQLKEKYLVFFLYEDDKELAQLKITLYDIIQGPQFFDYQIGKGRISFNMIMAQILQLEINPQEIICTMNTCIQEKQYVFNLKLVTRKMQFLSENSEKFNNPAYIRGRNASYNSIQDELFRIQWLNTDMPKLIVELPINEISSSSLQVCIWSINKSIEDHSPTRKSVKSLNYHLEAIDQIIFAESNIALNYLLKNQEEQLDDYSIHRCNITKGLWLRGNKIGQMQSDFTIKIPVHMKQQMIGLRTEKGCTIGTGILANQSIKEISEVVNQFEKLSQVMFKLSSNNQVSQKQQLMTELQNTAQQLLIAVSKSDKDSQLSQFYYKSYDDLMKGQEIFIKIAENLFNFVDKIEGNIREIYYEILQIVCTRGELSLGSMGYFDDCKQLNKKQLKFKNQICCHFQQFLYNTLNIALQKICLKDMSPKEKAFVEKFLASSFFKVPEFREAFVNALQNPNDPELSEWRGTDYQLDDPENFRTEQVTVLFDWQSYFYNYLPSNLNINAITMNSDEEWRRIITKRNTTFFFFVQALCLHIQQKFQKDIIPWKDIPGYRKILKALLCELKIRESYPDAMISAITQVVTNGGPLNVIIMILYNKTNIYSSDRVVQVMDLISLCIQHCQTIPTNFDYPFFLNGLRIAVTQSENAFVIAKSLHLIYNNYLIFPLEFKKAIVDFLFEAQCYQLFLHWSKTVRSVYISLLIYRIYHLHRNNKIQIIDENQFDKQYFQITKPKRLQSYYENRKEETQLMSDYIYLKYSRFMMNIETAKAKFVTKSLYQELPLVQRMKLKLEQKLKIEGSFKDLIICEEQTKNQNIDKDKRMIYERKIEFRNPNNKKTIILNENNIRYLSAALIEYNEMQKQYTKWRQQNIASVQASIQGMTDEEKAAKLTQFPVPQIKLMQTYDMKEGKQE
ncbi:unnamed protein product [Paramecium pentaurelia]|uniref:Uncharacterized protein n=1 Tax=Paramecium pentaurelia TaxID=43138 RepID=A0A8S1YCZ6_9CILI|nr:unnamed protein product [Paramecium pentaurelia]